MNKDDIVRAIVTMSSTGGKGFLVPGNLILTAAHCLGNCTNEGEIILGDHFIEKVITNKGDELKVKPLFIELVSDIAVLGVLDAQDCGDEDEKYEAFCERTKPIPICARRFTPQDKFPVHIYTHKNTWITGFAEQYYNPQFLLILANEQIERGTSGSPIVNDVGEIVGVVSNFNEAAEVNGQCNGKAPNPYGAVPSWIIEQMMAERTND